MKFNILSFCRKKFFSLNDEYFVLFVSLLFYLSLYFSLNNKTLLGLFFIFLLIFYWRFKGLASALFLLYFLFLPFGKGKSFEFTLISGYLLGTENSYNFGFNITFADLAFLGLFALIITRKFGNCQSGRLNLQKHDIFLFLFLVFTSFSIFFSQFQPVSLLALLRLLRMVGIYFIARIFLPRFPVNFVPLVLSTALIFQGAWASFQFVLQRPLGRAIEVIDQPFSAYGYLASEENTFFRAQGIFEHPNTLAAFLVVLLSFLLIQIFDPSKDAKTRNVFLVSSLVGLLGLLFSASRASWVVLLVMTVLGALFLRRQRKLIPPFFGKKWVISILLSLIVFAPFLILPRLSHLYLALEEYGGVYYRTYLLEKAWFLSQESPFGIGLATFPAVLVERFGFFTWPAPVHNLLLQILSEAGIFSLLFFLLFLIFTYKRFLLGLKNYRNQSTFFLKTGAFFASLGFFGVAQFYPFFGYSIVFEYFWLFLGIMLY